VLPFSLSNSNPAEDAVIETFILSMDNIGSHMVDLREEAKIAMDHLTGLEERLTVLHKATHRDNKDALADPWTLLGGNEHKLKKIGLILDLLKKVEKWRRKALSHVVATSQILRALDADMEKLRKRVAVPVTVGDKIPTEVHTRSIKAGTGRLEKGQTRTRLRQQNPGN
jgi:hypothetical protein